MKPTNFVVFNKGDVRKILRGFGFRTYTRKGKTFVYGPDKSGKVVCPTCKTVITTENLGCIAPGYGNTRQVYCDNPACFAMWVAIHKITDKD